MSTCRIGNQNKISDKCFQCVFQRQDIHIYSQIGNTLGC